MRELNFDNLSFANRESRIRRSFDETMFMRRHFKECAPICEGNATYKTNSLTIEKPEYNTLSMEKYYDVDA